MSDITGYQAGEPCECGQTIVAYCPRDAECRAEVERQKALVEGGSPGACGFGHNQGDNVTGGWMDANESRIEADCLLRDCDALDLARSIAVEALEKIITAAEPRDWETPGHPMNGWTRREPILRIARTALRAAVLSEGGNR